jgi:hypothetical protein
LVIVTQTETLILFRNDTKAGALIEGKGRIECDDGDHLWLCHPAGFRKQHAQHFRSDAAILQRFIDVQLFYLDAAGLVSGLSISDIVSARDNDTDFVDHEFLLEAHILKDIIPASMQPLAVPA